MKVVRFKRGQIWLYENNQSYDGSVQGKTRPVIIVSNNLANENSKTIMMVPCSSQIKRTDLPVHVVFKIDDTDNMALCENIQTINSEKLKKYIGQCDNELMKSIDNKLTIALGIENVLSELKYKKVEIVNNQTQKIDLSKSKITKHKKSIKEKQQFLDDLTINGSEYVMKKYNIKDKATVSKLKYYYSKCVKKGENK